MEGKAAESTEEVRISDLLNAVRQHESQLNLTERLLARMGSPKCQIVEYTYGRQIRYSVSRHDAAEEFVIVNLSRNGRELSMTCSCDKDARQVMCVHRNIVLGELSTNCGIPNRHWD